MTKPSKWHVLFPGATIASMLCAPVLHADEARSFIDTYITSQGGCTGYTPLIRYERGMNIRLSPFGKAAEKWTDDDFAALQRSIDACITNPTARSLSEEQKILSVTRQRVEQARAAYDVHQKQELASQAEFRSHRQERLEADASRELSTYGDHVMSPAEIDRVTQLRKQFPSLSGKVDELFSTQAELKQEFDADRKEEQERATAAQRIAAEKQQQARDAQLQADAVREETERQRKKQVLEAQLQAEEAKAEAERHQEAFLQNLPSVCKKASAIDAELNSKALQDRGIKAMLSGMAGDTKDACDLISSVASKQEAARASFVACAKALDNSSDKVAQDFAAKALEKAIDIHMRQAKRDSDSISSECR